MDAQVAEAMGKLTKLMLDWSRKKGSEVLWAWVRENGHREGTHAHLLIAARTDLPIGRMWRRWIGRITGEPYRAGVVKTVTIGRRLTSPIDAPESFRHDLFNVSAYCCKGVRSEHRGVLLGRSTKYCGRIIGKRGAVCQRLLRDLRQADR